MTTEEKLIELTKYTEQEGTELGDLWHLLIDLWEGYSVYMSPEFGQAVEREIDVSLEQAREMFLDDEPALEGARVALSVGDISFGFSTNKPVVNDKDLIEVLKEAIALLEADAFQDGGG